MKGSAVRVRASALRKPRSRGASSSADGRNSGTRVAGRFRTVRGMVGRVSTALRPMTDEEFEAWLPRVREAYADDMVRNAGADAEKARAKAEADTERMFPGGARSAEQL